MKLILSPSLILLSTLFINSLFGQNLDKIDSLKNELLLTEEDTVRYQLYNDLVTEYFFIDLESAELFASKALNVAEEQNDYDKIANAKIVLGIVNASNRKYSKSLELYKEAKEIGEKTGNKEVVAYALNNITNLYNTLENPEKALEHAFKVLSIVEELKDKYGEREYKGRKASIYGNIGYSYFYLKRLEEARETLKKSISIYSGLNHPAEMIRLNLLLGRVYFEEARYDSAGEYFHIAKSYADSINARGWEMNASLAISEVLFNQKKIESARQMLFNTIEMASEISEPQIAYQAYGLLAKVFEKQGEFKEAYNYHIKYKQYSDSVINEKTLQDIARIEEEIKFEEERKLIREKQKNKEQRILIIGIIMLLVLSVVFFMYLIQRLKAKKNQLQKEGLEKENELLEKNLLIKNQELTSKVMFMLKRNGLIQDVSEKLLKLKYNLKKENVKPVMDLIYDLQQAQDENIWKEFELRFTSVHPEFYDKLNADFQDLTANEKRICAYIRLNLTTKEISYFTGIRPNTIEVARTRLRKKFNLTNTEITLEKFLSEY